MGNNEDKINYTSDASVSDPKQDCFNRYPFAGRVVKTIISRNDPSSIVISINGSWGEGKTSVLNFIKRELTEKYSDSVICITFNPWRFIDENQLILDFFKAIKDTLTASSLFSDERKREIGEIFEKYGSGLTAAATILGLIASPLMVPLLPILIPAFSTASSFSKEMQNSFSSSLELDKLKNKIEELLNDKKQRIVILIDDIDRLDRKEIQAIFKLIKLSADFSYTTYVLAFDEDIVADALAEKYGGERKSAGKTFLEKIIQVPLHLPLATRASLLTYCTRCVQEALKNANIKFNNESREWEISSQIANTFIVSLKNPRVIKRFGHTLAFSLPTLLDEVQFADLVKIEGIRNFYPSVYRMIRENPSIFPKPKIYNFSDDTDKVREKMKKIIEDALSEFREEEQDAVRKLLKDIFPLLNKLYTNNSQDKDMEEEWRQDQRLTSEYYFNRFFSYSIGEGEISDREFNNFIYSLSGISYDTQKLAFLEFINKYSASDFMFMLKLRSNNIFQKDDTCGNLAILISKYGNFFQESQDINYKYLNSALIIWDLLKNINNDKYRTEVSLEIAKNGSPIELIIQCFNNLPSEDELSSKGFFSNEELQQINRFPKDLKANVSNIIVLRIKECIQSLEVPIYIAKPNLTSFLLDAWIRYGSKEEVEQYIKNSLNKNDKNIFNFINCFMPSKWSEADAFRLIGRPSSGGIEFVTASGSKFSDLDQILGRGFIYNLLIKFYGEEFNSSEYRSKLKDEIIDPLEQSALHFAYVHNSIQSLINKNKDKDKDNLAITSYNEGEDP